MRTIAWGQTPFTGMTREQLERHTQRLYAASESMISALKLIRVDNEASPFYGPDGTAGRAIEMGEQALGLVKKGFDSETIYRSFFRYSLDLLFHSRRANIGHGWGVCSRCGMMVAPFTQGSPCGPFGKEGCIGTFRRIRWSDLKPQPSGPNSIKRLGRRPTSTPHEASQ